MRGALLISDLHFRILGNQKIAFTSNHAASLTAVLFRYMKYQKKIMFKSQIPFSERRKTKWKLSSPSSFVSILRPSLVEERGRVEEERNKRDSLASAQVAVELSPSLIDRGNKQKQGRLHPLLFSFFVVDEFRGRRQLMDTRFLNFFGPVSEQGLTPSVDHKNVN